MSQNSKFFSYGFDFRSFPGAKIAMMDYEEMERLRKQVNFHEIIDKANVLSSILIGGIFFITMKEAGDIFSGFPVWIFVALVIIITQILFGIIIKKYMNKPYLEDILIGEKIEISTKIVYKGGNKKGKYVQILNGEMLLYVFSLTSLDNVKTGEDFLLSIAPKTRKIVSIKKAPFR